MASQRFATINFVPGPWAAAEVTRTDAGSLYNAVHDGIESEQTPTHSYRLAVEHASELNRRYHQAHGTGMPETVARVVEI